ncbi:hypothetical protein WDW89_04530 [Deltaproteobacteria bacterium TL4]
MVLLNLKPAEFHRIAVTAAIVLMLVIHPFPGQIQFLKFLQALSGIVIVNMGIPHFVVPEKNRTTIVPECDCQHPIYTLKFNFSKPKKNWNIELKAGLKAGRGWFSGYGGHQDEIIYNKISRKEYCSFGDISGQAACPDCSAYCNPGA